MNSLWGATDGDGSAAQSSMWRSHRGTSRKVLNLGVAGVAAAIAGAVAAQVVFADPRPGPLEEPATTIDEILVIPSETPAPVPAPTVSRGIQRVSYAVAIYDLAGLPPDAPVGTPLELWVSWDDRYAKGPQIQRLVTDVSIERYVQPITPDGPQVVMLSVPRRQLDELLYGDRYGALSAVTRSG